jgi:putative SOS response-associated peptidase YedK
MLTLPVEALRQLFMFEQRPNLMPRYNIAPTQDVPIVRLTRNGAARELITLRWGLVPFWADDFSIGNRLINARCETVQTLRAFREAYSRRRCLVPAGGFFEWQTTTQDPVRMIPKRENEQSAGICERHERIDSRLETTTPLRRTHSGS